MENIALIGSFISGLTALTTSLRALGVSREQGRPAPSSSQRSSLKLHLFVTVVWYVLSVLCALPYLEREAAMGGMQLFSVLLPFLLLAVLIASVWKQVLKKQ